MNNTICLRLSPFVTTVLCISEITMQYILVITCVLFSLFLCFVIICLH
jgi:hypothetical protein